MKEYLIELTALATRAGFDTHNTLTNLSQFRVDKITTENITDTFLILAGVFGGYAVFGYLGYMLDRKFKSSANQASRFFGIIGAGLLGTRAANYILEN